MLFVRGPLCSDDVCVDSADLFRLTVLDLMQRATLKHKHYSQFLQKIYGDESLAFNNVLLTLLPKQSRIRLVIAV